MMFEAVSNPGGGWGRSVAEPPDAANAGGSRWSTPATPGRAAVLKLPLVTRLPARIAIIGMMLVLSGCDQPKKSDTAEVVKTMTLETFPSHSLKKVTPSPVFYS